MQNGHHVAPCVVLDAIRPATFAVSLLFGGVQGHRIRGSPRHHPVHAPPVTGTDAAFIPPLLDVCAIHGSW